MNGITAPNEPLNAYSRVFFGLWGLVAILLFGFQTSDLTHVEQTGSWPLHHPEAQTNWLKKAMNGIENGFNRINTSTGKTPIQVIAFTASVQLVLPTHTAR